MTTVAELQKLLDVDSRDPVYVVYRSRKARLVAVDPEMGMAMIDVQRGDNPVVKVSVEELGVFKAVEYQIDPTRTIRNTPAMRAEYGGFADMVPRMIYFPEDVADKEIWADMEGQSPTIKSIWEFFNDFRRSNSELISTWFLNKMVGYQLKGIAVLDEPTFFFIYQHDRDERTATEDPLLEVATREAIMVVFKRQLLESGDWDIDVDIGKAEWYEQVPAVVKPEAGDDQEASVAEEKGLLL